MCNVPRMVPGTWNLSVKQLPLLVALVSPYSASMQFELPYNLAMYNHKKNEVPASCRAGITDVISSTHKSARQLMLLPSQMREMRLTEV